MKKLILSLIVPISLLTIGCNNGGDKNSTEGLKEISLVILDDSLSIFVPDSIKGDVEITPQSWGATELKIGDGFHLSIEQKEGDIELVKSDAEGDLVYQHQRYLKDEPSLLVWESAIPAMEKSYIHFYLVHKIKDKPYEIKDVQDGEHPYTESETNTMIEAAKTLQPKNSDESAEGEHNS